MPADSVVRRAAKKVLATVSNERTYKYVQATSMARDIRSGAFTEPELDLIPTAVQQGETALDVGANYGMWAAPLSKAVGDSGRVFAFEPIPFTVDTLRVIARMLRLKNVEIIGKAVGDEPGVLKLSVPLQDSGALSAGQAHLSSRADGREGSEEHVHWSEEREIECEVVTLDSYIDEVVDVSLLKLDIEGAELFALRGAAQLIERDAPTIVCEINPWFVDGFGLTVEQLVGWFSEREYEMYRLEEASGHLSRVDSSAVVVEDNYVFVHPRRADRLAELISA